MTTDEAAKLRSDAELEILTILENLASKTGLDMVGVEVFIVVTATEREGNPRRVPTSVRIDLAV